MASKPAKRKLHGEARRRVREIAEAVPDGREMIVAPLPEPMHERFCQALPTEPTLTAAAVRAGYSAKSARQQGSALCTNPYIQRRVAFLLANAAREGILSRMAVLRNASAREAGMIADFADLMKLPWSAFCEAVRAHPCARAIKGVKRNGDIMGCLEGRSNWTAQEFCAIFSPMREKGPVGMGTERRLEVQARLGSMFTLAAVPWCQALRIVGS